MLAQPLAFSLIVHHDCSSRSQAFIHARAGEHFAFIAAPHSIENVLRVLRSSMLPLCSLARERLALIVAHSCNSLALIVALACNSPVHTHRALIVPHRPSSSLILSSIVRSSTLELENVLRSSLLVHAHARERLSCVLRSSTLPLRSLARERLRSSSLLLATALSSLIVPHRRSCL